MNIKGVKLNFKRGLNRLFIVFMVGWYAIASFLLWPPWRNALGVPLSALQRSVPKPPPGYKLDPFRTDDGKYVCYESNEPASKPSGRCYPAPSDSFVPDDPPRKPIKETVFFALFPVLLYGVGLIAAWVFNGFRPDAGETKDVPSPEKGQQ